MVRFLGHPLHPYRFGTVSLSHDDRSCLKASWKAPAAPDIAPLCPTQDARPTRVPQGQPSAPPRAPPKRPQGGPKHNPMASQGSPRAPTKAPKAAPRPPKGSEGAHKAARSTVAKVVVVLRKPHFRSGRPSLESSGELKGGSSPGHSLATGHNQATPTGQPGHTTKRVPPNKGLNGQPGLEPGSNPSTGTP